MVSRGRLSSQEAFSARDPWANSKLVTHTKAKMPMRPAAFVGSLRSEKRVLEP